MTRKTLTIMQIIPELGIGGAEQGCLDMADAIQQNGHKSIVVSFGGTRIHELRGKNTKFIKMPVHSKNPIVMWKNYKEIVLLIEQYKIDIVHVRSRAPAWSAFFACKHTQTALVCTVHSTYSGNHLYLKRLYNSAMLKGDHTIAISKTIANYINQSFQVDEFKLSVINRGVDTTYFDKDRVSEKEKDKLLKKWGLKKNKPLLLMPARITARKGHLLLINALNLIKTKNYQCVILGPIQSNDNYLKKVQSLIDKHHLGEKVKIKDACKQMPTAYALADVVLTPSITPEAFGRIAVEAQAMGVPVIATDYGEYKHTVVDKKSGWKFPVNDAKKFASCIDEALNADEQTKKNMSLYASENARVNYTKEKMCNDTMSVYEQVLNHQLQVTAQ